MELYHLRLPLAAQAPSIFPEDWVKATRVVYTFTQERNTVLSHQNNYKILGHIMYIIIIMTHDHPQNHQCTTWV